MRHDTAGDPIAGIKWSRRTTTNISEQLTTLGIAVSKNTVGRLLKQMDFRLRVNRKQIATSKSPDRNQQFLYIGQQREQFASQGLPRARPMTLFVNKDRDSGPHRAST